MVCLLPPQYHAASSVDFTIFSHLFEGEIGQCSWGICLPTCLRPLVHFSRRSSPNVFRLGYKDDLMSNFPMPPVLYRISAQLCWKRS